MATQRAKDLACAADVLSGAIGYLEAIGRGPLAIRRGDADVRILIEVRDAVFAAIKVEVSSEAAV